MAIAHGNRKKPTVDSIREGSIVHIKSREWYEENKDEKGSIKCGVEWFVKDMYEYLDSDVVVTTFGIIKKSMFRTDYSVYWFTPEMVEYVVKY